MRSSLFCLLILWSTGVMAQVFTPIQTVDRKSVSTIELTNIGTFGILRKSREEVPAHLHTGIDIKRPKKDYSSPPFIFPIAIGKVVSKRDDGPFSQLIIEHQINDIKCWTTYEHIGGILVQLNDLVHPQKPIARFYTKEELDAYGWQFDHFHFEVIKVQPIKIQRNPNTPERLLSSYTLICYDQETLDTYFHHPLKFLEKYL